MGRDVEMRYMANGDPVANIALATSEKWTDKSGEKQERTEWHRISAFGKTAELAGKYLTKGSLVYFEGKLQTRKWQDKDGNERYTTEIIVDRMQFLGGKGENGQSAPRSDPKPAPQRPVQQSRPQGGGAATDELDDDIPF